MFRQHHHPAVVSQNPGKPNPEISKIIGIMWKESQQETRDLWLNHADVSIFSFSPTLYIADNCSRNFRKRRKTIINDILSTNINLNDMAKKVQDLVQEQVPLEKHHSVKLVVEKPIPIQHQVLLLRLPRQLHL